MGQMAKIKQNDKNSVETLAKPYEHSYFYATAFVDKMRIQERHSEIRGQRYNRKAGILIFQKCIEKAGCYM